MTQTQTFSFKQLIAYTDSNNGMVFIDGKYQTITMLKRLANEFGAESRLQLHLQNSICSMHFKMY